MLEILSVVAVLVTTPTSIDAVDGVRSAVSAVGDVDRDGALDFLVRHDGVYVISGADGAPLLHVSEPVAGLGNSLSTVGDVDGDEIPDFVVGTRALVAFVYSGRSGEVLHRVEAPSGSRDGCGFGRVVAGGADFDRDGVGDFAVGAPGGTAAGRVYLFSGRSGTLLRVFEGAASGVHSWPADDYPATTDREYPRMGAGTAVSMIPDINGDGVPELSLGCPVNSEGTAKGAKPFLEVLSGSDWSTVHRFEAFHVGTRIMDRYYGLLIRVAAKVGPFL